MNTLKNQRLIYELNNEKAVLTLDITFIGADMIKTLSIQPLINKELIKKSYDKQATTSVN